MTTSPGDPSGAGREPKHRVRLPVLRQTWSSAAFIHWRFDADSLRDLVPDGLDVSERDGSAWVSLVLFCATETRMPVGPALPPFAETNLRTYVQTADGREAIWFLSLEASSALTAAGGSAAYGVPYHRAAASVDVRPSSVRYISRRSADDTGHDIEVKTGAVVVSPERTELDDWLTGRWRAFAINAGVPLEVTVEHEPWPLRHSSVIALDENLLASVGLVRPAESAMVHAADVVHARLSSPKPTSFGRDHRSPS